MRVRFALLVSLVVLGGCAPAADLRVSAYDGPEIRGGRLVLVRNGPVVVDEEVPFVTRHRDGAEVAALTWGTFVHAVRGRFAFDTVTEGALREGIPMEPRVVSSQVVREGRAENRWTRRTLRLPAASAAASLVEGADYVLLVDTVRVDLDTRADNRLRAQRTMPVLIPGLPPAAIGGMATRDGVQTGAAFALYRAGSPEPLLVGALDGFGNGRDTEADRDAWEHSINDLVASLAEFGLLSER
jgi:hypothetical protein